MRKVEELNGVGGLEHTQAEDGEWAPVAEYFGCCDCGLIHRVEYREINGQLYIRAFREDGLTKEARAGKIWKCSIGSGKGEGDGR